MIDRGAIDACSGGLGLPVVGVNIIDENNKSSRLSRKGLGRDHPVIRVNAVHPYDGPARGNLGVDCSAVLVTLKDSEFKTERTHQKALSGFEILVNPNGHDSLLSEVGVSLRHLIRWPQNRVKEYFLKDSNP